MPNLTSLGDAAIVNTLYASNINPLPDIPGVTIETPTNFSNGSNVVAEIDTLGILKTLGNFSLYSGTNLGSVYTSVNRFSVKLNGNNDFVIYDNVNGAARVTIDATTGNITFNPPFAGSTLSLNNIDAGSGTYFPLFSSVSASGVISVLDVTSFFSYDVTTSRLTVYQIAPTTITDNTSSVGTAGQVLTSTGSAIAWSTAPAINNGTLTITNGTHITGSGSFTANQAGSTSITIATDATDLNTGSTIVARDATGNFSAGTMTGTSTKINITDNTGSMVYYNIPMTLIDGSPYGSNDLFASNMALTFSPGTGILGCTTIQASLNALFLTGMYSGMYNFLHLGQSANLLTVLPDATGTGFAVFNNSPSLITPALGTPSALVGTNITGTGLGFTAGQANLIDILQNNANADFQIPCLTTTHTGAGYYALKVSPTTTIFTYNTNTHTLKPTNISLSGTLADATASVGTSGQYLTSTGTGTDWVTLPAIGNGTLTITPGTYLTGGTLTFTANQAGNSSLSLGTNATDLPTASTLVARSANKNIGVNAVLYWDSINTTHYMSIATLANIMNFSYFNGVTTTIPFIFNSNGVATIPYIKDTASSNGVVGQYLTQGASGILWATLPAIGNGTLTITPGTYLTGGTLTFTANQAGSSSLSLGTNATSANTVSTIVARDSGGNFSAGTITANLIGTASTASTIEVQAYSGSIAMYPTFTQYAFTNQTIYCDGLSNFKYQPDIATLTTDRILATNLPVSWCSDNLAYGYTPTFPSPVTGIYFALTQLNIVSGSNNDGAQTFRGVLSSWSGGSAQVLITFRSRTAMTAEGSIISSNITVANLVAIMDIVVYNNAGIFSTYLYIKPSVYYYFDFTISGISRDTNNLLYPVTTGSVSTPAGVLQIASVLTALEVVNISGATTATTLTATGVISGSSFTGAGTGLTGTGASFTAGAANLALVTSSAAATAFPIVFATAATGASLLNETSLTYNPSTNAMVITTGTITCPTITGSTALVGGTIAGTTGRFTGIISQGTSVGVSSAGICSLDNTLAVNSYANIQLGYSSSNYNCWFLGARYNAGVQANTIFSLAPYNVSQTGCWYVTGTGNTVQAGTISSGAIASSGNITGNNLTLAASGVVTCEEVVSQYVNEVYRANFALASNKYETNCFVGLVAYNFYDVTIQFTTAPNQYAELRIDLATAGNVLLASGWAGRMSVLGSAYASNAWVASNAWITSCTNNVGVCYTFTITNPYSAQTKTLTSHNTGDYLNATYLDVPIISAGINTSAVAYPQFRWSLSALSIVSGYTRVVGRN